MKKLFKAVCKSIAEACVAIATTNGNFTPVF